MIWVFGHRNYSFIPYLACYTFKITRCKERKALISKVGALDLILLIISIAPSEIDMNSQITIELFSFMFIISIIVSIIISIILSIIISITLLTNMCSFKTLIWLLKVQTAGWKKMVGAKKVYKWWKRSIKGFLSFLLFYLMLTSILPGTNKFIPIIEKRRKKVFDCSFSV